MKKKMCAVCAVIGVMLLGSATAFFTDQGSAANEFIVGNVSVDLTEPGWNPGDGLNSKQDGKKGSSGDQHGE